MTVELVSSMSGRLEELATTVSEMKKGQVADDAGKSDTAAAVPQDVGTQSEGEQTPTSAASVAPNSKAETTSA